jgi:lipopolysaccharide cholinephosphotransferase
MLEFDPIQKHKNLLNILRKFHIFCEKHEIKYFIAAGSALGAKKYGGFIPWDDDVDIYITRENFEKLKPLIINNDEFLLKKIFFNDRILINDINLKSDFLDLSILEQVTDSTLLLRIVIYLQKVLRCALYKKIILNQVGTYNKLIFLTMFLKGKFLRLFVGKKMVYFLQDALCKATHSNNGRSFKLLSSDTRYLTVLFPKCWFDEYQLIKFEDLMLPTTKHLDEYLRQQYGNIINTPPKNEQIPSHIGNEQYLYDFYGKN